MVAPELHLGVLHLADLRRWRQATIRFSPGMTLLRGGNGAGKTTVLEAVAYLATRRSLRGVPNSVLVREGAEEAVIRAEITRGRRRVLAEALIGRNGRDRYQLNKQPLRRRDDLAEVITSSTFSPDDLELVKGGPSARRAWLDGVVAARSRRDASALADLERIVRQRSSLLRSLAPRRPEDVAGDDRATLEVWDRKLAEVGEAVASARRDLISDLAGRVASAYADLAGGGAASVGYEPGWGPSSLGDAIDAVRRDELRRGVTLVGPQRDEIDLTVAGLPARTHASQGEQRSLALALRLGAHLYLTDARGVAPILLLDDVFSELDHDRAAALVAHLPAGQSIVTTTGRAPSGTEPDLVLSVVDGAVASS